MWELVEARAAASPDVPRPLSTASDREVTFAELRDRAERVAAGLHARGHRRTAPGSPGSSRPASRPWWCRWPWPAWAPCRTRSSRSTATGRSGFVIAQTDAEFFCVPGDWNGFDFVAMAGRIADDLGVRPQVHRRLRRPSRGRSRRPSRRRPPTATRSAGCTTRRARPRRPRACATPTARSWPAVSGWPTPSSSPPTTSGSIAFPYAHIAGPDYLMMMLYRGCGGVLIEAFNLDVAVELFARKGATMAGGGPAFYQMYLAKQRTQPDTPDHPVAAPPVGRRRPQAARRCTPRSRGRWASRCATATA